MQFKKTRARQQKKHSPVNSASIFERSPSEKLQRVEDLWDDLAATPEAIPIHDWQKQELARRKTNLTKNPASARPWDEVKRSIRAATSVELILKPPSRPTLR